MKNLIIFILSAVFLAGLFFTSCQGSDKPPLYGFVPDAANHEIVNIDGRTNVVKIKGSECSLNILRYPLTKYKDQMIVINFSADVMRSGSDGDFNVLVNNLPDNPMITYIENAKSGVWYNMSGTITIEPFNPIPVFFIDAHYKREADFYFDNLKVSIENINIKNPGENNANGFKNLYVCVNRGAYNGNGTQERPFNTITFAMHYAKPGDTVFVDSGTYYERIRMTSGEEGKPITLTAMPGAEVIITPTIPITPQWSVYRDNIWVADISEYVKNMDTEFPQLFANRDSMVEARFPNMGSSMSTIMDYKRDVAQRGTNKNTVVASQNIPSDIVGARVVIWTGEEHAAGWGAFESLIRSVNGRSITLEKELTGFYAPDNRDPNTPHPGNPYYITGALAFLDAPGEYYFDKETNFLYFYPPWNGRPDQRTLTMRHSNNITIRADNTSFVNIKNITIYGGGISMQNSNNNTIENCRINYADHFYDNGWYKHKNDTKSESAMVVTGNNNRISKSEFGPTAGHGIVIEGDDNVFTNNIVHTVGYSGNFLFGICILNSKRLEVSFNTFKDASRDHIQFSDLVYERCIIRNNYFENHSVLGSDSGAVFTLTAETDFGGTEIYHNYVVCGTKGEFGTMHKLLFGLYTDNYNYNLIVRHNIVIGGGQGLTINLPNLGTQFYNNTVIGAQYGIGFYSKPVDNADASTVTVKDNLFVNTRSFDIQYWGTENGRQASYQGNFINGTIPVTQNLQGRMVSSGNARGTVDAQYRPTGRTPDIGAIPRGGQMFAYGADWQLGDR
ncbi:MAG: right-handed parallel beta-helix repeat-containing protein [Treponema sp.]|nr:right-handed parallel beta-helix repeat-containing protein [Treponema sp.]